MPRTKGSAADGTLFDPAPCGASTRGELAPPWTPQHPHLAFIQREHSDYNPSHSGLRGMSYSPTFTSLPPFTM